MYGLLSALRSPVLQQKVRKSLTHTFQLQNTPDGTGHQNKTQPESSSLWFLCSTECEGNISISCVRHTAARITMT